MVLKLDKEWLQRYHNDTLEGREDHRKLADYMLFHGNYYKAKAVYDEIIKEKIPVPKLVEAAEYVEEEGNWNSSINMYHEIVNRIDLNDRDLVGRVFSKLKYIRERRVLEDKAREIEGIEGYLLSRFENKIIRTIKMNEEQAFEYIRRNVEGSVEVYEQENLAEAYLVLGEPKRALEIYKNIGEELPLEKFIEAAKLRREKGKFGDATRCYEIVIENLKDKSVIEQIKEELKNFKNDAKRLGFTKFDNIEKLEELLKEK